MSATYSVRPGEVLIVSDRKRLLTTKCDQDQFGRMKPFGVEANTPTIVGAAEGAEAAELKTGVKLVKGEQGALPVRFGAGSEDQALRNAFEGRIHEPSLKEKTNALMENEGIRPASLADAVLRLIEKGAMDRDQAIAWARQEHDLAIRSGNGSHEPWIAKASKAIADSRREQS